MCDFFKCLSLFVVCFLVVLDIFLRWVEDAVTWGIDRIFGHGHLQLWKTPLDKIGIVSMGDLQDPIQWRYVNLKPECHILGHMNCGDIPAKT